MAYIATCRGPCVPNDAIPMPPYPPYWIGGGTTPPPDPNVLAVTCPTIPDTEIVGTPVTIRVLGQNFTGTCVAYLDNVAQPTAFVSATELDFDATGTVAKTSTITVKDGATTAQGTCQFKWTAAPILTVRCPLVPATAECGAAALPVTVNGTLFTNATEVMLDGQPQATTFGSATQVSFDIDPTLEFAPRTAQVTARDGAATAVAVCDFTFTQTVVVPTVTGVVPDMVGSDDPTPRTVTVNGTLFDASSVIWIGLTAMPTNFVSATQLTMDVDQSITNGSYTLRVQNGGTSAGMSTTSTKFEAVGNPTLNMLVPDTAAAGSAMLEVKLLGTNFGSTSAVLVDGVAVPTTRVTNSDLRFDVTPAAAAGSVEVSVRLGNDPTDDILPVVAPFSLPFTFT